MAKLRSDALYDLLMAALTGVGFNDAHAQALARQTVLAEELGQSSVGVAHVFDYTNGVIDGRINPAASPTVTRPAPTMILVNGDEGLPQTGFDLAFDEFVTTTRKQGMALFLSRNATLCGSLGTFTLRLAEQGLMAFAATNGSPLLAGSGSKAPVFCTNPLSFAAPGGEAGPLLIDQSCSATAYVNIRAAADRGETIPEGWAIDTDGHPTTDPAVAMAGSLLPFGGARGGNLALMVEVLAAGIAGAHWSIDAGAFDHGAVCPGTGLTIIAINADAAQSGFAQRMGDYLTRLSADYAVHVPGRAKAENQAAVAVRGLNIDDELVARLEAMLGVARDVQARDC